MKTLLHICCAPCANQCIEVLRTGKFEVTGFWYNPNIHPFTEYRARRNCLREYAATIELPLIERDDYGLRPFVREVAADIDHRCIKCYEMRLFETARQAKDGGFDSFTSSLFISSWYGDGGAGRVGIRRGISLPGFPALFQGRPGIRPGTRILYAEILRLRLLRAGAVFEKVENNTINTLKIQDIRYEIQDIAISMVLSYIFYLLSHIWILGGL